MNKQIERDFDVRGSALEILKCRAAEVLVAGPAGTGKSYACLVKLHLMMLLNPGARGLILRKTHVSLTETGLVTFRQQVASDAIAAGLVKWYGGSGDKPAGYRYSNGSFIAVGGMDKPMKVMSSEYDICYIQEATELELNDVEMVTTRLRNGVISVQQMLMDCNPQDPQHWLKLRCESGATKMLHSKHEDNPRYFNDDGSMTPEGAAYMAKLDALTGVRYLRLRKGIWAAAEGVIYEDFNPAVHLVDAMAIPEQWRRVWSVDFGYVHPFVWQDWAIGPDGEMILVREIYRTQTLVEDHARVIRSVVGLGPIDPLTGRPHPYAGPEVTGWDAKRPSIILCDHDAEDRATLERHLGWPTRPASKNVKDGIQATAARFRLDGRGRPRVFMFRDAVVGGRDPELVDAKRPASTPEEIPTYVWNDKGKDEPRKEMDDGSDTLRYAVMEVDVQPRPRVRFL